MNKEMSRELQSLDSERRMDKLALKGHQWTIAQQLNSSMGQDMKDVLEGKKQVKFSLWRRIKNKTTSDFSFCQSTISCKIYNNKRNYYIRQPHSIDCNNINCIISNNKDYNITKLSSNTLKSEYINKLYGA